MGRPPRDLGADATYHVMARGNRRQTIFRGDADRVRFLEIYGEVCGRYRWTSLAYCLMGNHVHLAVRTADPNLSDGMRLLLGRYARTFNRTHGLSDHLFRSRFRAVRVESDRQMLAVLRYIARNPLRGGLVTRPEEWPWSSFAATVGLALVPPCLDSDAVLALLHPNPGPARALLRSLVEDDARPPEGAAALDARV